MNVRWRLRPLLLLPVVCLASFAGGAVRLAQDVCGPFTDVSPLYCPYVLEAYYTGITAGTSPTTFSPDLPITRAQSAVFTTKALNQSLSRGSRRAALGRWWTTTPQYESGLGVTTIGGSPRGVAADGSDVWVATGGSVARVRGSDGRLLETWTGADTAYAVLAAMGRVFATGLTAPTGKLYMIDPTQPAGDVTTVADDVGFNPVGIAFDGSRLWITNFDLPGSGTVSIVTPGASIPWSVTKVTTGFDLPMGIVFDGSNIWVANVHSGDLTKLDENGAILQSVHVGTTQFIGFDGTNIWVPGPGSVTVVQAATGTIVATLTGNGIASGNAVAFDGERIMITNPNAGTVSLWRAADLAPLGAFSTGATSQPYLLASDGIDFWLALGGTGQLARF